MIEPISGTTPREQAAKPKEATASIEALSDAMQYAIMMRSGDPLLQRLPQGTLIGDWVDAQSHRIAAQVMATWNQFIEKDLEAQIAYQKSMDRVHEALKAELHAAQLRKL
jgi:hypothetical protein